MICAQCAREIAAGTDECPSCAGDPLLAGRYRLDRQLVGGALGVSYRATRIDDGLLVRARSCLLRRLDEAERERLALLRELDHPALPRRLDELVVGEGSLATQWLIDEHVAGHTLADAIAATADHRVDPARVLPVLSELAGLLAYLDAQPTPVVHGALTPALILIKPDERGACMLDLGLACEAMHGSGNRGLSEGLDFAAPEQRVGAATPASDLWTLGAIAVVALSGARLPQLRDADGGLRWRGTVELPPAFADLLERMLAADPNHRIRAAELAAALAMIELPKRRPTLHPWTQVPTTAPRHLPPQKRPKPVPPRSPAATRRTQASKADVPVARPDELSRELSAAQHAAVAVQEQQRSHVLLARVLVVLLTAAIAALVTYIAIRSR